MHRVNSIEKLIETPNYYGVEIDIRSIGNELILNHDPYHNGVKFKDWISFYKHGTLILNVKEEGLEEKIINELKKYNIESFFFLDQSFPFLIKTAMNKENRCAVRISEYESVETALSLRGMIQWVWMDIFKEFKLSNIEYQKLREAGFKLCLVSPELQKFNNMNIQILKNILREKNYFFDAICTKNPQKWEVK